MHQTHTISLNSILESFRMFACNKRFSWAEHNCVSFSLGIVECIQNRTVVVPGYTILGGTHRGFVKTLIENKETLYDLTVKEFGKPLQKAILAKKGDLVIEGKGLEQNMGIYYGKGKAMFTKENGLVAIDIAACSYAWRINNG